MIPDISHWKPVQDWRYIPSACEFIIAKGTQGNTVDPTVYSVISNCERYKIPYWLYVYLNKGNELEQAKYLVAATKRFTKSYFIGYALDIEDNNTVVGVQSALNYLQSVSSKTMIYTQYSQYDKYKQIIATRGMNCAWWEARYGINDGEFHTIYNCHTGVDLHQYTSNGVCNGITPNVDINRLTGTKSLSWFTQNEKTVVRKDNTVVQVGSARIDENGNAIGGKAGDQTGKEVAIEPWYRHGSGWYVIRAKDDKVRDRIAQDMEYACANPLIGYDQGQNQTLWQVVRFLGYNCSKVKTACETDCARLVRVCVWYAGVECQDFYTGTEKEVLYNTGQFDILAASKYCDSSDYLLRGDILVTRTKGHTVVVLDNGAKVQQNNEVIPVNTKGEEEMQCTYKIEGSDTIYWFDGQHIHKMAHPDCVRIVRSIYKDNNGHDMPHYKWNNKAPWWKRLQQAIDPKNVI